MLTSQISTPRPGERLNENLHESAERENHYKRGCTGEYREPQPLSERKQEFLVHAEIVHSK